MPRHQPSLVKKTSTPWDRLRPIKQDPLEGMGFVSKGDERLLDPKTQESFYHKIVARYMQFCSQHSKGLEDAFASLSINGAHSASSDPTRNPPIKPLQVENLEVRDVPPSLPGFRNDSEPPSTSAASNIPPPANELSAILLGLRKLREGLLATTNIDSLGRPPAKAQIAFSQRVHVFSIRLSILAYHPPSYFPSLTHLLFVLHGAQGSRLPLSELQEFITYLILDLALRQGELAAAYNLRHRARTSFEYSSHNVDEILRSVATSNYVAFWKVRRRVDGYIRALMYWYIENHLRKQALKVIGRSYLKCDVDWILRLTTGGEMDWNELVQKEDLGWIKDGDSVIIRKPKAK